MIEIKDKTFHLLTENTSYIFSITENGIAEHIYYGKRINNPFFSLDAIREKHLNAPPFSSSIDRKNVDFTLDDTLLEFSTEGKGDYKIPSILVSYNDSNEKTLDLRYHGYDTKPGFLRFEGGLLPQAISGETEADTLLVYFEDRKAKVKLTCIYTTFNSTDTISRRFIIQNTGKETLKIRKIASSQLDIRDNNFEIITLQGAPGRERNLTRDRINSGTFLIESRHLASSSEVNPAFILTNDKDTYLFNLVYSGAFKATISKTSHNITHIVWGLNDSQFNWSLLKGDSFESPEAILSYSNSGLDGISKISHNFIEKNIKRGLWKDRLRPLMFSTWSGYHYNISEKKVEEIIKYSKEVGFEGIVISDGWFSARNNEKSSLGDWYTSSMKFPSGLQLISSEAHRENLLFGLWIEPEVISERSELYKKHPDWIIGRDIETNTVYNGEHLLDLTRKDIQDWIILTLSKLIEIEKVDYFKWDLTRYSSDYFSHREMNDLGEFMHRYQIGLYRVLRTITQRYPNLYIEIGGAARFDLAQVCYSSSLTLSRNTDAIDNLKTFEGTSLVYPLSIISSSFSPSPDEFTNRIINTPTKFNISTFGVLSYSIFADRSVRNQVDAYKRQVSFYLNHRALFQYGNFKVEESGNRTIWSVSNQDKSLIVVLYAQSLLEPNTTSETLRLSDANENYDYLFYSRPHYQSEIEASTTPQEPESYKLSGTALKYAGIKLVENNSGNGYKYGMRNLGDFSSRLYIFKRIIK